jgi:hypothetical protein
VVLDVEYAGQARSPWGTVSAGFSARPRINRKDWGLTWNHALETGGVLIGDEITVTIDVELVRQPEELEVAEQVAVWTLRRLPWAPSLGCEGGTAALTSCVCCAVL